MPSLRGKQHPYYPATVWTTAAIKSLVLVWSCRARCTVTRTTVVSGAVVERVTFGAYVIYAMCLLGFIYPVVVHWGWSAGGWASAWR